MGLVNTVMVSVKLFPGGEWGIKKRLAPGAIHDTLKPSSSRRSRSLYFEPGQKIGFWVKFKLLGLAFKAPGGLAPTLPRSPAPRSGHPGLLPPCFLAFVCAVPST